MACDGVGPSFTCLQIAEGMDKAGYKTDVYAIRQRAAKTGVPLHLAFPGPLRALPYKKVSRIGHKMIEKIYLSHIREGDIAYLWPGASLEMHRILRRRGNPIVLEGINTRMASAKRTLDAAYERFGAKPAHNITAARIEEEEEKYALASAIFAPSKAVEQALIGSPLERAILSSSYGVDERRASEERSYQPIDPAPVFIFCGYACIRKGFHHLLEAWRKVPAPYRLRVVGRIEPAIQERYADLLASDRIDVVGFVQDVHPWFARSDIFVMPSLEEGDPLVTYEAALHGLPILASPMGGGRMADTASSMQIINPDDTESFAQAMVDLAQSREKCAYIGRSARRLVRNFHWKDVGKRRGALLKEKFVATEADL